MQGIFVDNKRPKSKKAVKEALADNPERVYIEATSIFGNEWSGLASDLAQGQEITFVGPDPATDRRFYGTLYCTTKGLKLS